VKERKTDKGIRENEGRPIYVKERKMRRNLSENAFGKEI
jgi:hypothetical protein